MILIQMFILGIWLGYGITDGYDKTTNRDKTKMEHYHPIFRNLIIVFVWCLFIFTTPAEIGIKLFKRLN